MWNIPAPIVELLKKYTEEHSPTIVSPRDKRRMFADEFTSEESTAIV
jgi:hypothetical protein